MGTGSRGQVARWVSEKSLVESLVTGSKEESIKCGFRQGMVNSEDICTVNMSPRIASILF